MKLCAASVLGGALVAALIMMGAEAAHAEPAAGVRQIEVTSDQRAESLAVTVWYPAAPGGEAIVWGESVFFEGTAAMMDAPIQEGTFPLIMLSHGAGLAGRAEAMSWIAAPLAQNGFIVAAPTHPGNTGPHRSAEETMRLWLRPSDVSAALDAVSGATEFAPHIAPGAVGVLGLSMGGGTALSLAGARLDPERYASYCDTHDRNPSLCEWVRMSGVDLHDMDKTAVGRDNADPRFRFVMAIDPAPADIFADATLPTIAVPVVLVNLGKPGEIPATVRASGIAARIPGASHHVIEDAGHASLFALCRPGAAQIALDEGIEDPICTDGGGRDRSRIHAQLIDLVTAAFHQAIDPER